MGMASAFPKKEIKAGLPVMSEEPSAMSPEPGTIPQQVALQR